MALVKCKQCGKEISKNAKLCPECGEPRSQGIGCGTVVVLLVFAAFMVNLWNDTFNPAPPANPPAPLTAEQQRTARIEAGFSVWDGAHRKLEKLIETNLKDPDSYEHIETKYIDKQDHILVYMKYRAKNSFGGFVIGNVVAKCSLDGDVLEIISQG